MPVLTMRTGNSHKKKCIMSDIVLCNSIHNRRNHDDLKQKIRNMNSRAEEAPPICRRVFPASVRI